MKLFGSKRGSVVNPYTISSAIIGIVVLFYLLAELIPTAQTAGDTLNSSGVPLGSLFTSGGVVFLLIMAAVVLGVLGMFKLGKGR